jgi:hypothetical protein
MLYSGNVQSNAFTPMQINRMRRRMRDALGIRGMIGNSEPMRRFMN